MPRHSVKKQTAFTNTVPRNDVYVNHLLTYLPTNLLTSGKTKVAFTLAEVLITLTIIGVVAALTMPSIIAKTQKQQFITGLKKAYSVLNIATLNVIVNNGTSVGDCLVNDSECFAELYKPYLKYIKEVSGVPNTTNLEGCWGDNEVSNSHESHVCLVLNDGMLFDFDMESPDSAARVAYVNVDVNGTKGPNKWGHDRYQISLTKQKVFWFNNSRCKDGLEGNYEENRDCAYKYLYEDK